MHQLQLEGYSKILNFIGVRGSIPVAEEKMLLDGVKMVLDNGWTIQDEEMLQLFDMC